MCMETPTTAGKCYANNLEKMEKSVISNNKCRTRQNCQK